MASKGRGKATRHEDMVSEAIMKERIKSVSVFQFLPYLICVGGGGFRPRKEMCYHHIN